MLWADSAQSDEWPTAMQLAPAIAGRSGLPDAEPPDATEAPSASSPAGGRASGRRDLAAVSAAGDPTEFNRQNLSYCYWKSGQRVHAVLSGEGDLDLLISRDDQHRAQAILLNQG